MTKPWYQLYSERYKKEREELASIDITFEEDQSALKEDLMILHLTFDGDNPYLGLNQPGATIKLEVHFPDYYPWFRPEVYAKEVNLARHQGLIDKNLCLLPRGTAFWNPAVTIAKLLQENLRIVFEKGSVTDPKVVKSDPTEQAEPYGEYYPAHPEAQVLFDPSKIDLTGENDFEQAARVTVGFETGLGFPQRMIIKEIFDNSGKRLHSIPKAVGDLFKESFTGYLYKTTSKPLITGDPNVFLDWLRKGLRDAGAELITTDRNRRSGDYKYNFFIGLAFKHEVRPGEYGTGWIFCVVVTGTIPPAGGATTPQKLGKFAYYAKPAFINLDAKEDRVPKLTPLLNKTASLVGLGALGGFVALELARAGIKELRILDFDTVDPPTTVRWPLGITAGGKLKTEVIKRFIEESYPYTGVEVVQYRIGEIRQLHSHDSQQVPTDVVLQKFLNGTDVLIDATAEEGINRLLNAIAIGRNLPTVFLYATPGGFGGMVMYSIPGVTEGCWNCVKLWEADDPDKYLPPFDNNGEIQPPGCGDKTFTGTSFDLQPVSLAAVKIAVGILCSSSGGYGLVQNNWAILSQVDKHENPILPKWEEFHLQKHPRCMYCKLKM